jgi:3-phenylpropionate/trans-cinnamate dioxygenase ferredoxin reductase subunit
VVVGGGVAAFSCIRELRAGGFDGRLALVSREAQPPYDRTLLSKDFLAPGAAPELALEPEEWYEELDVEVRLGVHAESIDPAGRRVLTAHGEELPYERLVLCTGGRALRPPALDAPGVMTLRDLADASELRARLAGCGRLVIVGGGFIGGEVAAAAARLQVETTVLEQAAAPLAPVLGESVGDLVAQVHRANGVEVRTRTAASAIKRGAGGYSVELRDGARIAADEVLLGVGMAPEVDLLARTGLATTDGIATDAHGASAAPGIMAAGDCAHWWHPGYGVRLRTEHWETARRHGASVARNLLGANEEFAPVPFFWSDQHDVKYQWVGFAPPGAEVRLELIDPPKRFIARYMDGGRVVAAFAAGEPERIAALRHELEGVSAPLEPEPVAAEEVAVDGGLCIGSGNCVRLARGTFGLNADAVAEVIGGPGADPPEKLELAARSCPTGAIRLAGDGTPE